MTALDVATARAALAPLYDALRDDARADARRRLADADGDADALLADARARADSVLAQARTAGAAEGAAELAERRSTDRRATRAAELGAEQEVYRELRGRVGARIAEWCARPENRSLLVAKVRAVLGSGAVVRDAPGGGVIGTVDGRRLDLTSDAVATLAVEALGADVMGLWAP